MGMIAEYLMVDDQALEDLKKSKVSDLSEKLFELEEQAEEEQVLNIDKIWDSLHYFLTGTSASTPLVGEILSELVVGKCVFSEDEEADFIAYTSHSELPNLVGALENLDFQSLAKDFNLSGLKHLYPPGISQTDKMLLLEDFHKALENMLEFYKTAFKNQKHVVVSIL